METIERLSARIEVVDVEAPGSEEASDLRNQLAWELVPVDIRRAASVAAKARSLALALGYERGITRALVAEASRDFFMAAYEDALSRVREALGRLEAAGDPVWEGRLRLIEGLVHWSTGDFASALDRLHRSLDLARETNQSELEGWALTSLGGVHDALGDLPMALDLHRRALAIFEQASYPLGRGRALSGLGNVFQRQGRSDEALERHLESLRLYRSVPSALSEARALNDLGTLYRDRGNYAEARSCLQEALRIRREYGALPAAITTTIHLGELALAESHAQKAIDLLTEAVSLAEQALAKPKLHLAHEALSRAYEQAGECQRALLHQRRAERVKEEVLSDEAAARLRRLQVRHEVERAEKKAEIERLRNVELRSALSELTRAQAQIVQAEKMASLGRIAAGVAHEMNSPLGAMTASLDVAERRLRKLQPRLEGDAAPEETLSELTFDLATASRAAERLGEIVRVLEGFSRVDRSSFQRFDLHESLGNVLALLAPRWRGRIEIVKRYDGPAEIEGYPAAVNEALMTLLSNAIEAIDGSGRIELATSAKADSLRLEISDNGRGFPPEALPGLFEVGFSRKRGNVRMHAGLANAHITVVLLHGGSIDVRSTPGEGTTFEILLPIRRPPVETAPPGETVSTVAAGR